MNRFIIKLLTIFGYKEWVELSYNNVDKILYLLSDQNILNAKLKYANNPSK